MHPVQPTASRFELLPAVFLFQALALRSVSIGFPLTIYLIYYGDITVQIRINYGDITVLYSTVISP